MGNGANSCTFRWFRGERFFAEKNYGSPSVVPIGPCWQGPQSGCHPDNPAVRELSALHPLDSWSGQHGQLTGKIELVGQAGRGRQRWKSH